MQKHHNGKQHHRHRSPHHHSEIDLQGDIETLRHAFAETAKDVGGKTVEIISDSVQNVRDKSSDIQESIQKYVAEKPFKSLGIAVLSGMLLGWITRRRH